MEELPPYNDDALTASIFGVAAEIDEGGWQQHQPPAVSAPISSSSDQAPEIPVKTTGSSISQPILGEDTSLPAIPRLPHRNTSFSHSNVIIRVTIMKERVGTIVKHTQYQIESETFGSVRRFSDFDRLNVHLLETYPFRLVPPLPPKRTFGKDDNFLDARRRGLARYLNLLYQHPILKQDQLFTLFLTSSEEFSKINVSDGNVQEEFLVRAPRSDIPSDLDTRLEEFEQKLADLTMHQSSLAVMLERFCHRAFGNALDMKKCSDAMDQLANHVNVDCCGVQRCRACQALDQGYLVMSQYYLSLSATAEDQSHRGLNGIVEDLRSHSELLEAFTQLFERRKRLLTMDIVTIQRRINQNQNKLNTIRLNPTGATKEIKEVDRLNGFIRQDEELLQTHTRRVAFMRSCMWDEFLWFHFQKSVIGPQYTRFVADMVMTSEKIAEVWKRMYPAAQNIPTSGF